VRHRQNLSLLIVSFVLASCGKKTEPPKTDGPAEACVPEKEAAECSRLLSLCMYRSAPPDAPESPDAPAAAPAPGIKIGATYVIGQGDQTVVMNPKPVDDGLRRFAKGSVCRYDPEGTAEVVGKRRAKMEDAEYDEYLVRYTRDPGPEALQPCALDGQDGEPYECPTGTVFFIEDPTILEEAEPDDRYEAARSILNSEKP
jgi:hypothetical protein